MPTKAVITNDNVSKMSTVNVLNAIRNEASPQLRAATVPLDAGDIATLHTFGKAVINYVPYRNEFLTALVNRIAMVIVTSKSYKNPWAVFKRGMVELGESIEEIFVEMAKAHPFDPAVAEKEVFKREIPDVRSAFHVLNYRAFYKQTISNDELRPAFLSWEGITDLIAKIVDRMYTAENNDEFNIMKYMLGRAILNGELKAIYIGNATNDLKKEAAAIKGVSNNLTFMKAKYNAAGVRNFSDYQDQYIIMNSNFDASFDVEVLAAAFNMDKADFLGHRILVDSFGDIDQDSIREGFGEEPAFIPLTQDELEQLDNVSAVIVDKDWWMVYDNLKQFTENYNGQGLYWQYFYHIWKTFSYSPFANAVLLNDKVSSVTSVTVTPAAVTVAVGGTTQLQATVEGENFPDTGVLWSSNNANVTVSSSGLVTVLEGATGTATITAKSVQDDTKTGTATITVG